MKIEFENGSVINTSNYNGDSVRGIGSKEIVWLTREDEFIKFAEEHYEDMSHPLAVASQFPILSDEWLVGLFHDILEDTSADDHDVFMFLSFHDRYAAYMGVVDITRKFNEKYFDYIDRVKKSELARIVKIADLKHNLSRVDTLKPSLKKRYEKALRILDGMDE